MIAYANLTTENPALCGMRARARVARPVPTGPTVTIVKFCKAAESGCIGTGWHLYYRYTKFRCVLVKRFYHGT